MKKFYKMKLIPTEVGLSIWTNTYYSVHETPCYYFCVTDWQITSIPPHLRGTKAGYDMLKNGQVKFKRVAKINSRIAFETKELAYDNLVYLKKMQLIHLNRDIKLIGAFVSFNKDNGLADLPKCHEQLFVPNTSDLVNEHYSFN